MQDKKLLKKDYIKRLVKGIDEIAANDDEVYGILLDDVLPSKYGRVVKKTYLGVFERER